MNFVKVRLTHTGGGIYVLTGKETHTNMWYMLDNFCCGYSYDSEDQMWNSMGDGNEIEHNNGVPIAVTMASYLSEKDKETFDCCFDLEEEEY